MLVGITGSIASGKSVISRIFETLGYSVFYADDEAKKLYYSQEIAAAINKKAGIDLIDFTKPDFAKIAEFIFLSPENNSLIVNTLYPFLTERIRQWQQKHSSESVIFVEAAMIFESGWNKIFNMTICVFADENIRLQRLRARNPHNYENCLARTKFQWKDDVKCKLADFVITNDGISPVMPQISDFLSRCEQMENIVGNYILKNHQLCDKQEYTLQNAFLYEVIRIKNSKPVFCVEHYERLLHSNNDKSFGCDMESFRNDIQTLIEVNDIHNCNVKVAYDSKDLFMFFIKSYYPDEEYHKKGADVVCANIMRDNPNVKRFNQTYRSNADRVKNDNDVYEVLLVNNDGEITEGSKSNVFFVKDNVIYTAPDNQVLIGITRTKVIETIKKLDIKLIFRPVLADEIQFYDGAFLTGTSIDVFRIRRIGDFEFDDKALNLINDISKGYIAEMNKL